MNAKAYSYVRFSTNDQIKGDSLRRQTEATAEWCKRNNVQLVESYRDLGVSAFRGKNVEVGRLAAFLKLVRDGRIPKGSYLIVESLDRLSRSEVLDALELFTGIIKSGVVLVTLSDSQVYDREKINANPMQLMMSLAVMTRAHEESKTKALRVAAAWDNRRSHIEEEKLTSNCVGWLRLAHNRKSFELIPERAAAVKRMFELAREGRGAQAIARALYADKVKTFGRARVWHVAYVSKILNSRAVIGEFTPRLRRDGQVKYLDPIPEYYPSIIGRELFATVQQIRKARPDLKGKASARNVFSKLLFDTKGNAVVYLNKGKAKSGRSHEYLVSSGAQVGAVKYVSWRYDEFLALFLLVCQNAALAPQQKDAPDSGKLDLARMELADTEKQIANSVTFIAKGASAAMEGKLRELEAGKLGLQSTIQDLESEVLAKPTSPSKVNWKDSKSLRENLRATVKRITVDAAKKSFCAEFLDGRTYTLAVEKGMATITTPEADTERRIQLGK